MDRFAFILFVALSALFPGCLACPENLLLRIADQSRGLLTLSFNPHNHSVEVIDQNDAGFRPNWLFPYQDKIYSISRAESSESKRAGLFAFAKSAHHAKGSTTSPLSLINSATSNGIGGVYVGVNRDGKTLAAADIDGSTISIHSLSRDGKIGEASQTIKYHLAHPGPGTNDSQIMSNPHQTIFEPSGRYMFVPDRGADRLYVYEVDRPHHVTLVKNMSLPLGTGPRHLTFRPFNRTRTHAYLVSELDNTVRVFSVDGVENHQYHDADECERHGLENDTRQNLRVEEIQVASTLRSGDHRTAPNNQDLAAEVALSSDGRFAYVSNRNTVSLDPDTIAVYSVQPHATHNHLKWLGTMSTQGKIPRHFSLSPDPEGTYIAVANQVSQNIIIFKRNRDTGFAKEVVGKIALGDLDLSLTKGPICVMWD